MGFISTPRPPQAAQTAQPAQPMQAGQPSFAQAVGSMPQRPQHLDAGGTVGQTGPNPGFAGPSATGNVDTGQYSSLDVKNGGVWGDVHNGITGVLFGNPSQYQAGNTPLINPATQGQGEQAFNQQMQLSQQLQGQNPQALQGQLQALQGLQGLASGTGPNPAQNQLNQSTGANVANQAALMAGQRGSSANPALMARQIAMQGAATQQQGAGQAATLGAQQQLAGIQGLGQQSGNMLGQSFNANQGVLGAINNQNQANLTNQGNVNNVNATVAAGNQAKNGGIFGGVGGLIGSLAKGGKVGVDGGTQCYDEGGEVADNSTTGSIQGGQPNLGVDMTMPTMDGPTGSFAANHLLSNDNETTGYGTLRSADDNWMNKTLGVMQQGKKKGGGLGGLLALLANGGEVKQVSSKLVPAMVSPDEIVLTHDEAANPNTAAQVAASKAQAGDRVPGKARVSGDSLKNDTVPASLEEGGIVVKRSAAKNPEKAAAFARAVSMRSKK